MLFPEHPKAGNYTGDFPVLEKDPLCDTFCNILSLLKSIIFSTAVFPMSDLILSFSVQVCD